MGFIFFSFSLRAASAKTMYPKARENWIQFPAKTFFSLITYSSLTTSVYNKLSNSIYHLQLLLRSRNDTRKHWTTVHGTLDVILKTLFMSQRCA